MELTQEEALTYIENKLEITFPDSDWATEFTKDKWGVLLKIFRSFLQKNYFQSISMLKSQSEPTRASSLKACIEGIGGVCIDNNSSLALILQALGYGAFMSSGAFLVESNPDNHVCCLVHGDSPGELWALDVGCSQVFHHIVPLHKLRAGQTFSFQNGGFEAQLRYDKEYDMFKRVNIKGDYYHGEYENEDEKVIEIFTTIPREYEHFHKTMKIIFTEKENSLFFQVGPALSRYVELNEDGSFKYLIVWGLKYFMISNESVERKVFANYEEMWPTIESFFPLIKKDDYDQAVKIHLECKKTKEEII